MGRWHLSRVPFSQYCLKIDNKRLFEESCKCARNKSASESLFQKRAKGHHLPVVRRGFSFWNQSLRNCRAAEDPKETLIPQCDPRTLGPASAGLFLSKHWEPSPAFPNCFGAEERNSPRVGLWTLKAPPVPRRGFVEQLRPECGQPRLARTKPLTGVRYDTEC